MLESPLRRYKRSYPIDFASSNQNQFKAQSNNKYDIINYEQPKNHQNIHASLNQPKKQQNPEEIEKLNLEINSYKNQKQKNYSSNHLQKSEKDQKTFKFTNTFDSINVELPLQQISKKSKVQIDQALLANARFQNNDEEQLLNVKTFQSISPPGPQIKAKCGNIRRQNIQNIFCHIRQEPLLPQNPFKIGVATQKQKYLQKLGISSGYNAQQKTYVSKRQYQNRNEIRRANSSFQMNLSKSKDLSNNRDNLPNFFNRSNTKFSNFNQQAYKHQQYLRKTEFHKRQNSLFNNKNNKNFDQSSQFKFQPNVISKIKQEINEITQSKLQKRNKSMNEKQHQKISTRQYTFNQNQNQKINLSNQKIAKAKILPKIQITYHTTLISLKNIIEKYSKESSQFQLTFKIPKIFINDQLFYKEQPKQQLHLNSLQLFDALKIPSKNMITKRYSNCILFISQNIIVIWHYNGKRFLGGWQYKYLNEGSKHGIGLQWQPNSHIYYGEFKQNKKHGIGAMKQGGNTITVGYWCKGKYIGKTQTQEEFTSDEQEMIKDEDWRQQGERCNFGL